MDYKGFFKKAGRVCDLYIPNRRSRKSHVTFGFVWFRKIKDANKSIQIFHGAIFRSKDSMSPWLNPRGITNEGKVLNINEELSIGRLRFGRNGGERKKFRGVAWLDSAKKANHTRRVWWGKGMKILRSG